MFRYEARRVRRAVEPVPSGPVRTMDGYTFYPRDDGSWADSHTIGEESEWWPNYKDMYWSLEGDFKEVTHD